MVKYHALKEPSLDSRLQVTIMYLVNWTIANNGSRTLKHLGRTPLSSHAMIK